MVRYETDDTVTSRGGLGRRGRAPRASRTAGRWRTAIRRTLVAKTRRPARIDDLGGVPGAIAAFVRDELGISSSVGSPIVVEGRLWGALAVHSKQAEPLPADTESRLENFTELVATAISNIQARDGAGGVAGADRGGGRRGAPARGPRSARRRAAAPRPHGHHAQAGAPRAASTSEDDAPALVTEALDQAERATDELRELAHGILPAVLTHGGLRAGVEALASRMPVPVENAVSVGRLPAAVEATAYFVVAEALTNVAKHARARRAAVTARVEDGTLRVQVRDDGVGGARPDGSGLLGLADRLAVLDGQLRVESPADGGTLVAADIPLPGQYP